jgi:hypothetical protein
MILNSKLKDIYIYAATLTNDAGGRNDVPDIVKKDVKLKDLNDKIPFWNYTKNGMPVSAFLIPSDFAQGADEPAGSLANLVIAIAILMISAAILFLSYIAHKIGIPVPISTGIGGFVFISILLTLIATSVFGTKAIKAGLIGAMLVPPFSFLGLIAFSFYGVKANGNIKLASDLFPNKYKTRDKSTTEQSLTEEALTRYSNDFRDTIRIKEKQGKFAATDDSRFIEIGTASGHFARHGDPFAPDIGQKVGLTLRDLGMHCALMGRTGAGKTVAIKKIVSQVAEEICGLFVVCGKGTLPAELVGITDDYVLLNPENKDTQLALFQDMSAIEVTDALCVHQGDREDLFFFAAARSLLKNCAVLLKELANVKSYNPGLDVRFTPTTLLALINSNGGLIDVDGKIVIKKHGTIRDAIIVSAKKAVDVNGSLITESSAIVRTAISFFENEFQKTQSADKTLTGVLMQANIWLEPLFTHEAIARWADCETGVDVTECCRGARIGLDVPAVVYGQSGAAIIANLVRQRLYSALKKRGNNWRDLEGETPVLMVIDEMHLVWNPSSSDGMDDNSMVSISRSLGGIFLVGTQSVDEMESRFGADKTLASLGNFRNFICYDATAKTLDYAASRAGMILREKTTINNDQQSGSRVDMFSDLNEVVVRSGMPFNCADAVASSHRSPVRNVSISSFVNLVNLAKGEQNEVKGQNPSLGFYVGDGGSTTYPPADASEMQIMLEERFAAVCLLNRAGAPRRDVVIIEP